MVDDTPANLVALEAVLDPLGYRIVKATSGEEALKECAARDFVLLLIDVHMPGLDGYQTTALLRRIDRARDVPVMFVTGVFDQPEHTRRGYELGAVDYVSKPYDAYVLRAKVRALVTLYTKGREAERRRAEEAERMRELFLGAIGHDLRNPLNAILVGSKLMVTDECASPRHRTNAMRIERSGLRMQRIIEDILDLTRKEFTGTVPLSVRLTNLADVCRNVVEEQRMARRDRALEIEAPAEVQAQWDGVRLGRVVSNLVGNALEHAHEGPVRVTLRDTGAVAVLQVHNRGTPIDPALLPGIFEPFHRGEASANGLGLGLYIVREIVRAHGGRVDVSSTAADGTTFTVRLPKTAGA